MAVITKIKRSEPTDVLDYPPNFSHATCPCKACRFPAGEEIDGALVGYGDCKRATKSRKVVVSFTLDDGRSGAVTVPPQSNDAAIAAAIGVWAQANPIPSPDPLSGLTV